jgi:hypothetical protein
MPKAVELEEQVEQLQPMVAQAPMVLLPRMAALAAQVVL